MVSVVELRDAGRSIGRQQADATQREDGRTSGIFQVPIAWLDLTAPDTPLHLKLMKTWDAHRAHIWSRDASFSELTAWARSQAGWTITSEHRSISHVFSFTLVSLPAGLAWLAQLSSCQHLELHPDENALLHLVGVRENIQSIHERLQRSTDVEVVRVAQASEDDPESMLGPRLTGAQREALEAAHRAGFFAVPREIRLDDLADQLDRSRSSLSTLLRRGIGSLVGDFLDQNRGDDRAQPSGGPPAEPGSRR